MISLPMVHAERPCILEPSARRAQESMRHCRSWVTMVLAEAVKTGEEGTR